MKSFKRAKRHKDRIASKSTKIEKSYYKLFVLYSIILLIGIFLPQYLGVYYLEYSFLYIIVLPICLIVGIYLKFIKKVKGGTFYLNLWATFCIVFSFYTNANVIFAYKQKINYFSSEIESVESSSYRSPAFLSFQIDDGSIALIVTNEYPVKEEMERGETVRISGQYKKGMLSSIMIVDYTVY